MINKKEYSSLEFYKNAGIITINTLYSYDYRGN
jgi:hypothetical protein